MKKLPAQKPRPPEVILTMTEDRARRSTQQLLWSSPIGPGPGDHRKDRARLREGAPSLTIGKCLETEDLTRPPASASADEGEPGTAAA
jgi:hypothetical protein